MKTAKVLFNNKTSPSLMASKLSPAFRFISLRHKEGITICPFDDILNTEVSICINSM